MAVLIKPLITEKMNRISETLNQFGFVVDKSATKDQIKAEIEKMYNVEVTRVNTMLYMGKRKTRFTKAGMVESKKSNFKKAIVHLKDGQSIDFFENI